jgi:hypothetical protein
MIYHNQGEHANHYTADEVLMVYHVTRCFVCEVYKAVDFMVWQYICTAYP